ncbi:MAG TPA: hypothetical protein VFF70_10975, partial [Anaerolineae bacterium]|nr:hypothetical protein [Anaerolineae bacterium]
MKTFRQSHLCVLSILIVLISAACTSTDLSVPPLPTPTSDKAVVNLPPTAAPTASHPTEVAPQGPCRFSAAGSFTSGWYWLRDAAYTAIGQLDCRGLPTDRDLTISLPTLVTNKADGGSGYSSPVKIIYLNPTSHLSHTVQVYLQNPSAEQSPANSKGVGYPTTGYFVIPKAYIDTSGGLFVQIERFKPNTTHVAVNAQSLNFDRPRIADSFGQSKGILIADWYWLQDTARQAYGQWTFKGLSPTAPATLVFDLLVTNKTNGGSGYSTPIEITLINPSNNSQKTLRHVSAQNLLFTQNPNNSNGIGYQTYGSIVLDNTFIDAHGNLIVRVARLSDATNHLAVNQNSVAIIQPEAAQDLATPLPGATKTSGLDGQPSGKYLFIQYWNKIDGTGTLPALAIDFPDYRFDPRTGELSSFNPNRSITLASTAMGFIGHGTSRSGDAGTGAMSSLDTIDRLPYSIDVAMFTGSVNVQAVPNMEETKPVGLKILAVAEDGTISIELDHQTIKLAPGESWTRTVEAAIEG